MLVGRANAAVASVWLCRWNCSQSCAAQVGRGCRLLLPWATLWRAGQCCVHHVRRTLLPLVHMAALHRRAPRHGAPHQPVCALLQTATPWLLRTRSVAWRSGDFSIPNQGASAWSHGADWHRMQPPCAPSLATPRSRSESFTALPPLSLEALAPPLVSPDTHLGVWEPSSLLGAVSGTRTL